MSMIIAKYNEFCSLELAIKIEFLFSKNRFIQYVITYILLIFVLYSFVRQSLVVSIFAPSRST